MDWVPVSKEKLEGILAEELEALRPEVMRGSTSNTLFLRSSCHVFGARTL
jgi:hypothetical protein